MYYRRSKTKTKQENPQVSKRPATASLSNMGKENLPKPKYRSWTYNDEQFLNAAEKEVQLLMRNPNFSKYWLIGTLSLNLYLTPAEHQQHYKQFAKQLRKRGIILDWVRHDNGQCGVYDEWRVHYHFIVLTTPSLNTLLYNMGKENLLKVIEHIKDTMIRPCIPQTIRPYCEIWLRENDLPWHEWIRYIFRALCRGEDQWGDFTEDKHKAKRQLWPQCGLKMIGCIGEFYGKSKKTLWREYCEEQEAKSHDPKHQEYKRRLQEETRQRLEEQEEEKRLLSSTTYEEKQEARRLSELTGVRTKTILLNIAKSRTLEGKQDEQDGECVSIVRLSSVEGLSASADTPDGASVASTITEAKQSLTQKDRLKRDAVPVEPDDTVSNDLPGDAWLAITRAKVRWLTGPHHAPIDPDGPSGRRCLEKWQREIEELESVTPTALKQRPAALNGQPCPCTSA